MMQNDDRDRPLDDLGFGRDDQPEDDLVVERDLEETAVITKGWREDPPVGGGRKWPLIGLAIVGLVAAGVWFLGRPPAVPPVAVSAASSEAEAKTEAPPLGAPAEALDPLVIPDLDASDAVVRELVARLSSHPGLTEWLATDRLVRRFVVATVNVSEGVHPRKHLPTVVIEGAFQVDRVGGVSYPDPATYDRYRSAVSLFTSIDPQGTAELYTRLRPLFNTAYRDLGYPRGDFDDAMRSALQRMVDTPIPETSPALIRGVGVWEFEDPRLESLTPAQKQLIRLGPTQQRLVRSHLLRIAEALGLEGL